MASGAASHAVSRTVGESSRRMMRVSPASGTNTYRKLVLILGLAGFVSAADNWFVSPALPAIALGFGVSVAVAGAILTAYMIPYGFMQPIYGFFSDGRSKVKLLRVIVFGLAIGTAGSALSNSLTVLCAWRVLTGFFAAGIIAVSLSLIGDTVPHAEQQTYVGRFMGIVFAGQGLSSGLGCVLIQSLNWRGAFLFFAVVALCATALLYTLPAGPSQVSREDARFLPQCRRALFSPEGKVIFPLAFLIGFLVLGIYGYLGSFLHEYLDLSYMQSGAVVMFYGFACLFGGSKIGALAKKIGRNEVVLAGEVFALVSAALLCSTSLFPYWQIALVATVCLGLGYISVQSTLATIALDITAGASGLPSGLIGLGLFCGGGLGSAAGGLLLLQGTYQTIWISFGVMLLVLLLVTAKLRTE